MGSNALKSLIQLGFQQKILIASLLLQDDRITEPIIMNIMTAELKQKRDIALK